MKVIFFGLLIGGFLVWALNIILAIKDIESSDERGEV